MTIQNNDVGIRFFGGDKDSGEVFVVETKARAGHLLESHRHEHAHLSVLVSGSADVTVSGVTKRFDGYCLVAIPANSVHKVVAVTDIVWLCLWSSNAAPIKQAAESLNLVTG